MAFGRMKAVLAAAAILVTQAHAAEALRIEAHKVEAKSTAYEIAAQYPSTGLAAIDTEIKAWIDAEVAQFKKQAAPEPGSALGPWTLDIAYTVERNDTEVLALSFTESTYTGGAHGSHFFRTYNYLLPDGRRVDLAQILDGRKGLAKLSAFAVADLDKRLGGPDGMTDAQWIRRGAGPDWGNFENFLLLSDALKIKFPPYQVAAYAAGPQEVRVPLSALDGVLRADRRAPVASFDCAKAATPVERAVCADSALARLDREVAQAYGVRLGAVEAEADKQAIRTTQRAWLQRRDAACKEKETAGSELGACLTGVYRMRLDELSAQP
ncbi:DUF3298 domain-containing protein [Dokdonella sp.]|uniref:DUF3298 domain-containing protein n=1 Tax=Dokdonella sp. TaxID=2291710 RepID=UPI001B261135|nr:DUF3298 domain-containing protein [Dokdonella sp.]MBO9661857.1 DUF3298 domain-containing protein [Dokdonella sp.]